MTKTVKKFIGHTREELNELVRENGKLQADLFFARGDDKDPFLADTTPTQAGRSFFLTYVNDLEDVERFADEGLGYDGRFEGGSWDHYGDYPEKAHVSYPKMVKGYSNGSMSTTGFVWKQVNDASVRNEYDDMYYLTTVEHEGNLKVIVDTKKGRKIQEQRGSKYFVWYDVYFTVGTKVIHLSTNKWGVIKDFINKCDEVNSRLDLVA